MSEFHIDIDKALENAKKNDLSSSWDPVYPQGAQAVKIAVENCEQLCGLDKKEMGAIAQGTFTQMETLDSTGKMTKKIVIEYDVRQKD
tara:strand:- start:12968 stop:13231 length:264 start_codon:yes stop_codon:yes gene_type:complete